MSAWLQAIGRIVRVGQTRPCLIIQLFMLGTYNQRIVNAAYANNLGAFVATLDDAKMKEQWGETSATIDNKYVKMADLSPEQRALVPKPLSVNELVLSMFVKAEAQSLQLIPIAFAPAQGYGIRSQPRHR
jgi:hypothetical protein